jgi:hypothetical protein
VVGGGSGGDPTVGGEVAGASPRPRVADGQRAGPEGRRSSRGD